MLKTHSMEHSESLVLTKNGSVNAGDDLVIKPLTSFNLESTSKLKAAIY